MLLIDSFIKKIRAAGSYNSDMQACPICILWPDSECQWENVIPILMSKLPELLILGDYDPENRTGPAIWLRCVIAGKLDDVKIPSERTPILYLPGVSRQDLRDVERITDRLKPLAELQYHGTIWSQINSKDWTILAFLKSEQGGLGLDVAQDNGTKNAMLNALDPLLNRDIEALQGKRLDQDFFNNLLADDYERYMLHWLDQGDAFKSTISEKKWQAFMEICESKLGFNPEKDGILTGATRLASHDLRWQPVWERFCEAPKRYGNIPNRIRNCKPPTSMDWFNPGKTVYDRWPQWNDAQEKNLRQNLMSVDKFTPPEAREKILELEKDHRTRRTLIWAELGEAPLAQALEHLAVLAKITEKPLIVGTINFIANEYQTTGWQADDAMLQALFCVEKQEDIEAITKVIRAIYTPWAEKSARYLQKTVDEQGYPTTYLEPSKDPKYTDNECILFVDGLRFDVAKRLARLLKQSGYQIEEEPRWAPLPSVTSTGKPAVTPVKNKICGKDATNDFEPCVAESGQSLKSYHLKKLLTDAGWQILDSKMNGNGDGNAWCEFGDIDREGHERGCELAKHIDNILKDIRDRVAQLFAAGWKKVRIVTDHGWLLLPGNLPKIELPKAQTLTKWGRCAAIKPGAVTQECLYPWYWNPTQHFALADGISCFRNGMEYDHGGLSVQECLTLEIKVSPKLSHITHITPEITDVIWKGLRCNIAVDSVFEGLSVDIRTQPGNSSSSVIFSTKCLRDDGTASVVVENEDLEGTRATIVLINKKGELVTQVDTIIGGEKR
ncbi:MAG: BREX-1 system phosphatase PglZ type B [Candidatus Bathyarchaeota archaeon]|nr:MAG: BREX-1 system phosphatase PglZ type B [Candidatus Bathyarchaeota archaeon]